MKNEVLKLLDTDIVYLIFDKKWVGHAEVVPKKMGVTIIRNYKDELVVIRTVRS